MQDEYSYKRLLQILAAINAKIPILSVGFSRADSVEAFYSNDKRGGIVRRRKAGLNNNKALLTKFIGKVEAGTCAAYIFTKDSRKLVSMTEAVHLAENHLQGLDVLSIHGFEATRYSHEMIFKAYLTDSVFSVEVKPFASPKGQELKDPRLTYKAMLVGKLLITAIEKLLALRVCELVYELIFDEDCRAKLVNVEVLKLTKEPPRLRVDDPPAELAEALKEQDPDRRKQTRTKFTDIGHMHFLELLFKKFEQTEKARNTDARLEAIRSKYSSEEAELEDSPINDRLQRVLSSDFSSVASTSVLHSRMASRAEIELQVQRLLQPKVASGPKKPTRIMKPISYQKRKHLMPTKMSITKSDVKNSAVWAVNKFRKERLKNLELPHYSIKHSLSPTSPANRLISLLMVEEESRIRRKAKDISLTPSFSLATTGNLVKRRHARLLSVNTEPPKKQQRWRPSTGGTETGLSV